MKQSTARNKATDLFGKIVRSRGECEAARAHHHIPGFQQGCNGRLECSHIKSRSYMRTRTWEPNALCLCNSHHRFVGANPDLHHQLAVLRYGDEAMDEMNRRALVTDGQRWDWRDELARLEARVEELGIE